MVVKCIHVQPQTGIFGDALVHGKQVALTPEQCSTVKASTILSFHCICTQEEEQLLKHNEFKAVHGFLGLTFHTRITIQ